MNVLSEIRQFIAQHTYWQQFVTLAMDRITSKMSLSQRERLNVR